MTATIEPPIETAIQLPSRHVPPVFDVMDTFIENIQINSDASDESAVPPDNGNEYLGSQVYL